MTPNDHIRAAGTALVREQHEDSDLIDISAIFSKLVSNWRMISVFVGVFVFLSIVYLQLAQRQYTAEMVISPKNNTPSSGLQQFSGLAAMAGISIGKTGSDDFQELVAVLSSQRLYDGVAAKPGILQHFFPAAWDPKTKTWSQPWGIRRIIGPIIGLSSWHAPNGEILLTYLDDYLQVSQDTATSLVTLTFTDSDPQFAKEFLTLFFQSADGIIRNQNRTDSVDRIAYLNDKLKTETVAENRDVLIQLLSQEQQKLMLVEADSAYSALVVDPAIVPTIPSWPRASVVLVIAVFLGLLLGSGFVLLWPEGRPIRIPGVDWLSSMQFWRRNGEKSRGLGQASSKSYLP